MAYEVFERDAAYFISIGVPYDLYWGGNDPEILREYIEADRYRQERMNNEAWLHGAYVAHAISATIGNVFLKEGAKPAEYPKEPIEIIKREQTKMEKEKKEEQDALFAEAYMMQMVQAGKSWGKKS